jgi:hypothetical protein
LITFGLAYLTKRNNSLSIEIKALILTTNFQGNQTVRSLISQKTCTQFSLNSFLVHFTFNFRLFLHLEVDCINTNGANVKDSWKRTKSQADVSN